MSFEFMRLSEDNLVFLNWNSEVINALYVNNLLIFAKKLRAVLDIKKELKKVYKMKDLSKTNVCLGIQIWWDWKNQIFIINQHAYIDKVLKDFSINNLKAVYTLIHSYEYMKSALKDEPMTNQLKYQKAVESLMYTMTATHSDLTFAGGKFSQFCHLSTVQNWADLQCVFQYLQGSKNVKITYSKVSYKGILRFSDSDYTEDSVNRKFTHEYVFTLAEKVIAWFSQKQKITVILITEAEYVRLCSAVKTAVWITEWLKKANLT